MTLKELKDYLAEINLPDDAPVMIEYTGRYGAATIDGMPMAETLIFGRSEEVDVIHTFCACTHSGKLIIKHHY